MRVASPLRRRRAQLGLTQAQLAVAAGVSRQLVAAVEAGVNTPAVDAALRLARALDCPPELLFGDAESYPSAPAGADGIRGRRQDVRPPIERGCLVVAGCDPALGIAESMLASAGAAGLVALDATTGAAVSALRDGSVHAAVAHGRPGRLPDRPVDVLALQFARWHVGLGVAPGVPVASLEDCLAQGVPIVQRPQTASSQQALRRAAQALGCELPPGMLAAGHLDAARAAAALGCAAITTEGAARMYGLRFLELELHTVEVWIDRRWRQHPGVEALGNLLSGSAFAAEVGRLGGYDLSGAGAPVACKT